ncbi:MAG: RNA methyltransferase, partial [Acidobacteriota bacterium]
DQLTSDQNPKIKDVRRAADRGTLTKDGFALAEGRHMLMEALNSQVEIGAVILSESTREELIAADLERLPESARILRAADATFTALRSTETSQGVITLVRLPDWTLEDLLGSVNPLLLIVDGIQDPGNAGAILRAAEAFSATGVIFLKGSVHPYNPKCLRASAGSIFRLPVVTGLDSEQVLEALEAAEIPVYATDPRATITIAEARLDEASAIVIGAEGAGVSRKLSERSTAIRIPTAMVESLNAAVAAGVVLYEAARQRETRK